MPSIEIDRNHIVFDRNIQTLCKNKKNTCPNYNHKWSCPPAAPYWEDYILKFEKFFIIYFCFNLKNFAQKMRDRHPEWSDKMCRNSRYYNNTIRKGLRIELKKFLDENNYGIYKKTQILWGGTCRICMGKKWGGCTYDSGNPCRFPKKRQYSMEAVGIDVDKTVRNVGIELEWPPMNKVYQIGLVCFMN